MNDIIDDFDKPKDDQHKKQKLLATITFVITIIIVFSKYLIYYQYSALTDSILIPRYTLFAIYENSFISGMFLSIGMIISFLSYFKEKYIFSLILNSILIAVIYFFPYFYTSAFN